MKITSRTRFLSLALVLCMVLTMLPAVSWAAAPTDVSISGASGVTTTVQAADLPVGYRAYNVYDIRPQGYTHGEEVTVSVKVDDTFDTALPVLVMDESTGKMTSCLIEEGTVTFPANHAGTYVVAQADQEPITGSGTAYSLTQVMDVSELKSGVPYVIADFSKNWVLTNKATTVSGKTYPGLQLEGTPSGSTSYLWYLDSEGYLVYGKASSTDYLLVGVDASGNPTTVIGAVTDSNGDQRSAPIYYNGDADNFAIRNVAATGYLNRWGGKDTDTVATRYTSPGGSFWHLFQRKQNTVRASVMPSMRHIPVSGTTRVYASVTFGGAATEDYEIAWASSRPEIATVSADGLVMPTGAGRFVISATITKVQGESLTKPLILQIPMSAYSSERTQTAVSATGYTAHTSEPADNLVAGKESGPYVISNPSVNPTTYLSGNGPVTSKYCTGLEILTGDDGSQLWYFDGKYLRYGAENGPYLAYENSQVVLSTDVANAFDDIYAYTQSDGYIIRKSSITGSRNCLNQLGGYGYYAAGLYSEYSGSRWIFNQVQPAKEVTLTVSPCTSTVTLGKTLKLTSKVLLDGAATSEYTIYWASRNTAVATVSNGVVTPVSVGHTVLTATVTKAGGQDVYMTVELPLTVVKASSSATSATAEGMLPAGWVPVTEALPSDRVTGPYLILNRGSSFAITGKQNVTSSICTQGGLGLTAYVAGDLSNLWYYDGSGLIYGSPDAKDRYMVYEGNQIGLGADTGMNFNEIYLTSRYAGAFNIANANLTGKKYANQLGGGTYGALGVWTDDGDTTAGSGWKFYTLGQEKQVGLTISATKTAMRIDETANLSASLKVDGKTVIVGSGVLSYASSNPSVATVDNGVIRSVKGGTTTITATLSTLDGGKPGAQLSVELPVTVYGIKSTALNTKSGALMTGAAAGTSVGAVLTVTYDNGSADQVPITAAHLQNADGSAVSTATAGTYKNLKVIYNGTTVCTDFTLTVRDGIPANGTVYGDKSVTGVSFFTSRVALVELKAGGINGENAAAAGTSAYILDTMGNYFSLQTAATRYVTPTMQIMSYPLYSLQDYNNGSCTLSQVGTRKGSGTMVEKITFSADGTKAYSSLTGSTNIMSGGVICAKNFWYNTNPTASFVSDNGSSLTIPAKTLRWKVGTLSNTELTMSYYIAIDQGKAAGTYAVGRYTDLYYTDASAASQRTSVTSPTIYYEEGEEEIIPPTLTPSYASLSFEDEILYNVYFTVKDQGDVTLADMGMITFDSKATNGTVANCTGNYPGAIQKDGVLMVQSGGIPAKKLGDTLYFKIYAKLSDGTYVYTDILSYSAKKYAKATLAGSDAKLKSLVVAMLNYGAAAQSTFNYNTANLVNNELTAEQQALISDYNATMVPATTIDSSKTTNFSNKVGFSKKYATVSFESAFALNYYFTPDNTPDGAVTMYYWSQADYQKLSKLSTSNATRKITMTKNGAGEYTGDISGIAAKELGQAVYVAVVCTSGGQQYCSGVIAYSVGVYCKTFANSSASDMYAVARATIVYGYYAKSYFDSL